MKQLNGFRTSFIILAIFAVAISSCKKENPSFPPNDPDPIPTPVPIITWIVTPIDPQRGDTAYFGEQKSVTISAVNADSFGIIGKSLPFQATFTGTSSFDGWAKGKGGYITSTKILPCFSQSMTLLCQNSPKWGFDYAKTRQVTSGGAPLPSPLGDWSVHPMGISINYTVFYTNTAITAITPSGPNAGTYPSPVGSWNLLENNSKIFMKGNGIWDFHPDFINNKWHMNRITQDPFNTLIYFETEQGFKIK